jgi:hypothetical protein
MLTIVTFSMAGWTITAQAIDPAGTRQFSVGAPQVKPLSSSHHGVPSSW